MWTAQSDEVKHLRPVLLQVGESSTAYKSTKTMGYDTDLSKAASWTVLINMRIDLLSQANPHFSDVALSVIFVRRRHQEHHFWEY